MLLLCLPHHELEVDQAKSTCSHLLFSLVGGQLYSSNFWNPWSIYWVVYFMLYKKDSPRLFEHAKSLVSTMGYWYIGEYFTYIIIWGSRFVHLLPRIVPDKMVLEEVAYQTMIEGIHQLCYSLKRKSWPNFPISIGHFSISTSTHANLLRKKITTLKLEESSKRMHDPRGFLATHFS